MRLIAFLTALALSIPPTAWAAPNRAGASTHTLRQVGLEESPATLQDFKRELQAPAGDFPAGRATRALVPARAGAEEGQLMTVEEAASHIAAAIALNSISYITYHCRDNWDRGFAVDLYESPGRDPFFERDVAARIATFLSERVAVRGQVSLQETDRHLYVEQPAKARAGAEEGLERMPPLEAFAGLRERPITRETFGAYCGTYVYQLKREGTWWDKGGMMFTEAMTEAATRAFEAGATHLLDIPDVGDVPPSHDFIFLAGREWFAGETPGMSTVYERLQAWTVREPAPHPVAYQCSLNPLDPWIRLDANMTASSAQKAFGQVIYIRPEGQVPLSTDGPTLTLRSPDDFALLTDHRLLYAIERNEALWGRAIPIVAVLPYIDFHGRARFLLFCA